MENTASPFFQFTAYIFLGTEGRSCFWRFQSRNLTWFEALPYLANLRDTIKCAKIRTDNLPNYILPWRKTGNLQTCRSFLAIDQIYIHYVGIFFFFFFFVLCVFVRCWLHIYENCQGSGILYPVPVVTRNFLCKFYGWRHIFTCAATLYFLRFIKTTTLRFPTYLGIYVINSILYVFYFYIYTFFFHAPGCPPKGWVVSQARFARLYPLETDRIAFSLNLTTNH